MSSPRPTLTGTDVPQAPNLTRVRAIVEAAARGATSAAEAATATGLSPRHAGYAMHAARTLGLLAPDSSITPLGESLRASTAGSEDERRVLRRGVEDSPVLAAIAPHLLSAVPPTRRSIVDRILRRTKLARATADHRAGGLLAWRAQLVQPRPDIAGVVTPRRGRERTRAAPRPLPAPVQLRDALVRDLIRDNPWWEGRPTVQLPAFRRDFLASIRRRLDQKLAPIVVVRGPRQVGKTTAQFQLIEDLLAAGVAPTAILRVQFDDLDGLDSLDEPILRIVDWYEATVLGCSLNEAARAGRRTYLFLDEVQNLSDWAIQLKHLVDGSTTQVVVTGSSALRIELGRDSLAGRISSLEVGTLTLREIAGIRFGADLPPVLRGVNGLDRLADRAYWESVREHGVTHARTRNEAFRAFSDRGGYPLVHAHPDAPWPEVADQLNETVIRRVIQHDLRIGDRGRRRDAPLLEEVFRLACRYAGQTPTLDLFVREAQRAQHANVGAQRVRHYLEFLDRTLLLRLIRPLEIRIKRTRGAPKICLADHGLRASWLQELVPLDPAGLDAHPELAELAGRIAESTVGAYLSTITGLDLAHFPERSGEPEVDFIVTIGTQRIPVEVKFRRRIQPMMDTEGLRSFIEKRHNNAPFGILVTQADEVPELDPRIVAVPLASLLMMR